jgi:cell division protein FtsI (penicillin-binding protein 3)
LSGGRWTSDGWEQPRVVLLIAGGVLWVVAVICRLYFLQVENHEHYREKAVEQQQKVVELDAPRGTIYDARGRQLAVSVEVASVGVYPRRVKDPEFLVSVVGNMLALDRDAKRELTARLKAKKGFTWIRRKIDPALAKRLRDMRLEGIEILPESKRVYPMHELASQVLGYVGTDNKGLAGLEFLYERDVASEQGRRTVMRDGLAGTRIDPDLDHDAARPGKDVYLTIDAALQQMVERELSEGIERTNAKRGSVVMSDPATGAILAMASWPTFDPNHFKDFPKANWRNQVVMDAFEPGSTFKMVTLAAALEAQKTDLFQSYFCGNGSITLYGTKINDHKKFGVLTVREIMAKSSNVGAIHLGRAAGNERLYATIEAFGFGRVTGIDLPSENPGLMRPLEKWSAITPAYVSFGQGISVTPLQLVNAFGAIANGGRLLRPHVVASVGGPPRRNANRTQVLKLPIAPSSVREIRSSLESVVLEGTAKNAALAGYRSAGKTGTAQKAGKGGYLAGRYIASFIGFAPVETPAVVVSVVLDEPWPSYHGGDAAAPIFERVASQALLYLGVRPEHRDPQNVWPGERKQDPVADLALVDVENALEPLLEPLVEPPPAGTVPVFVGMSARQALARASQEGLRATLHGHGAVTAQRPEPGTPLEATAGELELWLGPVPAPAPALAAAVGTRTTADRERR